MNPAPPIPWIDLAVLAAYLAGTVGFGCWFLVRNRSSDRFITAGRSLPGWAVGLSIFGSYVSSISFLANPGKTYADNWNPFVFALSIPAAAWIATRWFVPFYRRSGEVSAYHHLEARFGAWARSYAVVCFILIQLARLGTILYLLALALQPMVGVRLETLILILGLLVTVYPMLGGTEGVMWTGVIQSLVLLAGPALCLCILLAGMPEGPGQVFSLAAPAAKFSLGSLAWDFTTSTFWVVLFYGLFVNLNNFGIDQAYVQRYITARSDRAAARSVWLGGLMYLPVGGAFFFVGTALFAFYQAQPWRLPEGIKPDAVFPHFIHHELPLGLRGLVLAAVCAAAMDSNLNCNATLFLCDLYRRYLRPAAGERESMAVLRVSTLAFGLLSTGVAVLMIRSKSALDAWWELAGVFSSGLLGLFLLGFLVRRAGGAAAAFGAAGGLLLILWLTWSPRLPVFASHPGLRSPFHPLLTIVLGTLAILALGALAGLAAPRREAPGDPTGPSTSKGDPR